jgi:hypothetical protein
VVVFEPDTDLLLDLLVDTANKSEIYEKCVFSKCELFILVNELHAAVSLET